MTISANGHAEKTFTVKINSTFPGGSDYVMTNIFGNTVNIQVAHVLGIFIAPKTGATSTIAFVLASVTVLGFVGFKKRLAIKLLLAKAIHI